MKERKILIFRSPVLRWLTETGILMLILCGLGGCGAQSKENQELAANVAYKAKVTTPIDSFDTALSQLRFENHQGTSVSLGDLSADYIALMLGFTQCPDVCPTGLMDWHRATSALKSEHSEKLQFVFLTVDPQRDTRDVLARYVPHFNPRFVGLRADPQNQSAALKALHAFARKVPGATPGYYTIDHTATVFLIDSKGNKIDEIRYGSDVESIIQQLENILDS